MSKPKDKDSLVLNPVTGKLDMVRSFNVDRILTADKNSAGNALVVFDPLSGQYLDPGPQIITDENGNLVVV